MNRERSTGVRTTGTPSGQMSASEAIRKRSVTVAGHRTSISLEEAFWHELRRIAASSGHSISQLITQIDRERAGNLSSAIRVFVLAEVAAGSDRDESRS